MCSNLGLCMLTDWSRLSHAGPFWVSPPSLNLCSSPSGLGAGSYTQSGCWWHVGTCLDLLYCLSEAEWASQRHWRGLWSTVCQCEVTDTMGEPRSTDGQSLVDVNTRVNSLETSWEGRAARSPRCLVSVKTVFTSEPDLWYYNSALL